MVAFVVMAFVVVAVVVGVGEVRWGRRLMVRSDVVSVSVCVLT